MLSYVIIVAVFAGILVSTLGSFSQSSWAQDGDEAAKKELERQAELAKKEFELQKELAQKAREVAGGDDDDDGGLNLSFGRFDLANTVMLGTVAAVVGVAGYAGYKLISIRRKAALARRKPTAST